MAGRRLDTWRHYPHVGFPRVSFRHAGHLCLAAVLHSPEITLKQTPQATGEAVGALLPRPDTSASWEFQTRSWEVSKVSRTVERAGFSARVRLITCSGRPHKQPSPGRRSRAWRHANAATLRKRGSGRATRRRMNMHAWLCHGFAQTLRCGFRLRFHNRRRKTQHKILQCVLEPLLQQPQSQNPLCCFCRHCVGVLHAAVSLIRCATNREWACRSLGFSACTHCVGRPAVPGTTWTGRLRRSSSC